MKITVIFTKKCRGEEVANVIYTIFINKVGSINVPSNVYNIPKGTSCVQNTNWINKTAFNDFNSVTQSPYQEGIRQMYYNGIMSGSLESDGGIYF